MTPFYQFRSFHRRGIRCSVVIVAMAVSIMGALSVSPSWAADEASVARGGRLYDNWFQENKDQPPLHIQPQYKAPQPSMHSIELSWRCTTCHGWDYEGVGDQDTGPLSGHVGNGTPSLEATMSDANHRYGEMLSQRDLADLAAFIANGRIIMSKFIKEGTNHFLGDAAREKTLYSSICANCHGTDGHQITTMEPLGTFVRKHPQEALHKVLNGHPAERMPPLRFLKTERLSDLLAFVQTLPSKDLSASVARGGRLYDNWQKETDGWMPTYRHPAYPKLASHAAKPEINWRCKECHGWDYKGRDGAYRRGPHNTGIKGIRSMVGAEPQAVVKLLMDQNHHYHGTRWFNAPLDLQDLIDLANFVTNGQIDMDLYIDPQTGVVKGNQDRRKNEFNLLCATCHGTKGNALNTGKDIGVIARENPWEALHKIRNGHPAEAMPALQILDMSIIVDILAYTQTLP